MREHEPTTIVDLKTRVAELESDLELASRRADNLNKAIVEALWGEGKAFDHVSDAVKTAVSEQIYEQMEKKGHDSPVAMPRGGKSPSENVRRVQQGVDDYERSQRIIVYPPPVGSHLDADPHWSYDSRIRQQFTHHMREMRRLHPELVSSVRKISCGPAVDPQRHTVEVQVDDNNMSSCCSGGWGELPIIWHEMIQLQEIVDEETKCALTYRHGWSASIWTDKRVWHARGQDPHEAVTKVLQRYQGRKK